VEQGLLAHEPGGSPAAFWQRREGEDRQERVGSSKGALVRQRLDFGVALRTERVARFVPLSHPGALLALGRHDEIIVDSQCGDHRRPDRRSLLVSLVVDVAAKQDPRMEGAVDLGQERDMPGVVQAVAPDPPIDRRTPG